MNALSNAVSQVFRSGQGSQRQQTRPPAQQSLPPPRRPRPVLSEYSTPSVPDSAWASLDFMQGAGMVLIQRNTHKIVMVFETKRDYWFFPRGRKDIGESLEQTALREAYEESGHRAHFLPLLNPTRQPSAPEAPPSELNTEPIFITIASWGPKYHDGRLRSPGGEYLTSWYVGEILEDAIPETGTGMPNEQHYRSELLTYEEALQRAFGQELMILKYAWTIYQSTLLYRVQSDHAAQLGDGK
ncbi:hypothetical protein CVT26_015912 [Gymnopilus dilepis]|uniref:Nudix hydrolase domain-containing protein n=1 Tax=Gymnopilus dilepis TaxID=231916 RepID=A0A409XYC8_9AGAR|nr:hypothetical protein CVT26_015912 [Gymnopilus dilepis]